MNCAEARFALEADPSSADPALAAHVQTCAGCAGHRRELRELDRRLRAALEIPVPSTARGDAAPVAVPTPDRVVGRPAAAAARVQPTRLTRSLALAAGVGGVAVLAGLLWTGFPRASLADAVVAHMAHEPAAWTTTAPLPERDVDRVLARSGGRLRPGSLEVTYASTCWFRGRRVPHLVVQTPSGPVTVMVLRHERVATRERFDEGGYRGVLVPAGAGALAVLTRDAADLDAAAGRALDALRD